MLTLYATDGRKFKQTYTFTVKANTPPPKHGFTVVKTKSSPAYYVLCIMAPGMDKKVTGGLLHKDLARIEINGTPYTFSVDEANHKFVKPETDVFITLSEVEKLTESGADDVPAGGWVLYYKTDVEVKDGAVKKEYTVRLADAQGLVSDILNASIKPNKAEAEQVRITKGTVSGSRNGDADNPVIIGTDSSGAELSVSSATANTMVHCTLTDTGSTASTTYNGNPVTVPLPLNGTGEKRYKLEYYTDGEGFAVTPVKTIYYKVVQGHTVNYRVDGENGKIQAGSDTAVSSGTVSVLHGGNITFTAKPDEGFEVAEWKVSSGSFSSGGGTDKTANLSNVIGDTTVTVKFKKKAYTITFEVNGGNGSLKGENGTNTQTASGSSVTFTVLHGDSVTFTATPTDPTRYKVGDWTCTPSKGFTGASGQPSASLTVTADTTVSVQFVELNALTLSKLEIHGQNALAGSVTLPYTVTQVEKDDISLGFSGQTGIDFTVTESLPLTLTEGTTQNITINVAASPGNYPAWSKMVSITRAKNDKATLKSFTLNGETKTAPFAAEYTVASDHAEVEGFIFDTNSTGATASVNPEGNVPIPEDTGKTFTITVKAQDGTEKQTVTFTVKRKKYDVTFSVVGGTGGTLKAEPEDGSASSTNPVSVTHGGNVTFTAVPDNGYEVDSWSSNVDNISTDKTTAKLSNVTETTNKTVTVKFKKKVCTVTYRAEIVEEEAGGKIQAGSAAPTTSSTISVMHGDSVTFTAHPTNTDWEVAEWKKDDVVVNGTSTTYTLSNVTSATTVTVKFYQSTLKNPATWRDLARAVKSAPANSTITIDGEIQATDDDGNNGVIDTRKILIIKGNTPSAALNANGKSGILDAHKTLTLKDITLKNSALPDNYSGGADVYANSYGKLIMEGSSKITSCSAANSGGGVYVSDGSFEMHASSKITNCTADKEDGGGVYVRGGTFKMHNSSMITGCSAKKGGGVYVEEGIFKMQDSAIVTPSTGHEQYTAGKNDVYLETGKTITVDGTLSNNPAARITPREYTAGHSYLTVSGVVLNISNSSSRRRKLRWNRRSEIYFDMLPLTVR